MAGSGGSVARGGSGLGGSGGSMGGAGVIAGAGGTDAGAGGAEAGAGGGTEPVGRRWRNSLEAFCFKRALHDTLRVWSDAIGVYLAAGGGIYGNTGSGWSLLTDSGNPLGGGITGFVNGPLVRYGGTTERCGIEFLDRQGVSSCSAAAYSDVSHVHVVGSQLAFAGAGRRIYSFDGAMWHLRDGQLPAADFAPISRLWADSETLLIAASDGVYLARDGAPLTAQMLPAASSNAFTAVWGSSAEDAWAGNADGQLFRLQEDTWSLAYQAPGEASCAGIRAIWGTPNDVFVVSASAFFRIKDGVVTTIASHACGEDINQFVDVWGNSANEVFVARRAPTTPKCGSVRIDWFDGSELNAL
ncbi:MAG: hypothetical protein ACOY0T_14930 [Myxococcota bacterium]